MIEPETDKVGACVCVFRCVFWHFYLVHVVEHWEEGKKSVLSFNLCKIHASKKYKNVYTSI